MYTYAISLRVNILNKIVIKHQLSYMIDLNVWLTEKSIAIPFGLALYINQC